MEDAPRTPRELAALERVQPPPMTRTIAALLDLGLVTRSAHPSDRRQVLLALSRGRATSVRETRRRRDAWLAPRLRRTDRRRAERPVPAPPTILRRIADS